MTTWPQALRTRLIRLLFTGEPSATRIALAVVGLCVSLAVHVASYAGLMLGVDEPLLWLVFAAVFPLLLPLTGQLAALAGGDQRDGRTWVRVYRDARARLPESTLIAVVVIWLFGAGNAILWGVTLVGSASPWTLEVNVVLARALSGVLASLYALGAIVLVYLRRYGSG